MIAEETTPADIRELKIADILLDDGTQFRVQLDEATVEDYRDLLADGETLPPVVVFRAPSGELRLASGFHRVEAHKRCEKKTITAEVRPGNLDLAQEFALQANRDHGLRPNRADHQKMVRAMLEMPQWKHKPAREIARHIGCNRHLVSNIKKELSGPDGQMAPIRVRRGDQEFDMAPKKPRAPKAHPEPKLETVTVAAGVIPPSGPAFREVPVTVIPSDDPEPREFQTVRIIRVDGGVSDELAQARTDALALMLELGRRGLAVQRQEAARIALKATDGPGSGPPPVEGSPRYEKYQQHLAAKARFAAAQNACNAFRSHEDLIKSIREAATALAELEDAAGVPEAIAA